MRVGEQRWETPYFGSAPGISEVGPQPCTVVRIHPQDRFYVVEFRSNVTGETFRESFYFPDRAGSACTPWESRDGNKGARNLIKPLKEI